MKHIFVIGSKGIPGAYGGYETFVDKLTEYHQQHTELKYHISCKSKEQGEFEYHQAHCFRIKVPSIGPAQAIYYDVKALQYCCTYIRQHHIEHPVIYILACRIGPFLHHFKKQIKRLGGVLYVNPDGHEWMRAKWSAPVRAYWKVSERLMVKHADLLICDSTNIESYIRTEYARYQPKTTYIAYGAEVRASSVADEDAQLQAWLQSKGLSKKAYYLVVGRFVPENNFETMIREFMKSKTTKDFALMTNVSPRFLKGLAAKTNYPADQRIKFVGTMYDQKLLMKIREEAYGYFHGHEVGGTNPSLLEALGCTDLNLLLDCGFNREVGMDGALYWNKCAGHLADLIDYADQLEEEARIELGRKAKQRIQDAYTWEFIAQQYETVFLRDETVPSSVRY